MKRSFKKFSALLVCLLTLTIYQNCAEFLGSGQNEFTSRVPEDSIPSCKDLDSGNFLPVLDFSWKTPNTFSTFDQVMSSPTVGDINSDGYPEIAFVSFKDGNYRHYENGVLRVLNGKDRSELFSIGSTDLAPNGSVAPLLIDIDRDGFGEIVYPHYKDKAIIALNFDGSLRWKVATDFTYGCYGGLSAADLNGDGKAEIIKNGEILFETKLGNNQYSVQVKKYKANGNGCSHFAMNLSASDAGMPIVDSSGVYEFKNGSYQARFEVANLTCGFSCYVSAADVDPSYPGKEIIYTGHGAFRIYSSSGQIITNKNLTEHNPEDQCRRSDGTTYIGGGTATIGNFDNDESTVEFAIATGKSLTVFDKNGVKLAGSRTTDCSSISTGVTSFDFNGDGNPEILYSDEEKFRVYQINSLTGELDILWETINTSGTIWEYPVVADLDNDWSPEVIVVSNNYRYSDRSQGTNGLRIYTAPNGSEKWMPTRNVWNQHNYFISNVDLGLAATSSTSYDDELARNFKRNLPGKDIRCKKE